MTASHLSLRLDATFKGSQLLKMSDNVGLEVLGQDLEHLTERDEGGSIKKLYC